MFHPYKDWMDDPERCVYLGSEINPRTKMKYDFWAIKTSEFSDDKMNWSATARHGMDDCEYGSAPMCVLWYDNTGIPSTGDFIFGMDRAKTLTLYYLATGQKPLVEAEERAKAEWEEIEKKYPEETK